MNTKLSPDTLLSFPTEFTIKVFGEGSDDFETAVLNLMKNHIPSFSSSAIKSRSSQNNKYRALNVTIYVESKSQLDAIYQDLTDSPHVLMAL